MKAAGPPHHTRPHTRVWSLIPAMLVAALAATGQTVCAGTQPASTAPHTNAISNLIKPNESYGWFDPAERVLLFSSGDMDCPFWRIPAIEVCGDGSLVAMADRRRASNEDLPGLIDIVTRRSLDNGRTWSEPEITLEASAAGGYGDAAIGLHRTSGTLVLLAAHGNGIFQSTDSHHTRIIATRSHDNGLTWEEPTDITGMLFSPHKGHAPIQCQSAFVTSGRMHCDEHGRLYAALVTWDGKKKWAGTASYCIWSDDGGRTWEIGDEPADRAGDESKISATPDGRLIMSIRNPRTGHRRIAYSSDRGLTWTEPQYVESLIDPGCNGAITQYGAALLHTTAYHPSQRQNASLLRSDDNGLTWRKLRTICQQHSAYTDMVMLADGTLAILTEEGSTEPSNAFRLWLTLVPPSQLE